jgi:Type IV secretion system pilin
MLHYFSRMIRVFGIGSLLLFATVPTVQAKSTVLEDATSALDSAGATTYGDSSAYEARPGFMSAIANIVRIVLGLLGILFVILIIYAGVLWMTSAGNADQVEKARGIIVQAVIGLVVILASYAITTTVFKSFGDATGTTFSGIEAKAP